LDPVGLQERREGLANLVEHVVEIRMRLEGRQQHDGLLAESARLRVPASELNGGGGLALSGVSVQQDDRMVVKGTIEHQECLVPSHETLIRHVTNQARIELHGVQLPPLTELIGLLFGEQLQSHGLVTAL
ncbi:MAG: hypothetical protein GY906_39540, partial [bacterium]|nr:hypothetical protein [bacterium]